MSVKERCSRVSLQFALTGNKKGFLRARDALNCDCRDGAISAPVAWTKATTDKGTLMPCPVAEPTKIFTIRTKTDEGTIAECFGILNKGGEVWVLKKSGESLIATTGVHKGTALTATVGDTPYTAVFGDGKHAIVDVYGGTEFLNLSETTPAAAFFKHRLFVGGAPSKMAYSSPENFKDFIPSAYGSGVISLPNAGGKLLALMPFRQKLYLFFEYGIYRFEAGGTPPSFQVERVEYGGGRIFGRTVYAGNEAIYFVAVDGIYRFDGTNVERIFFEFAALPAWESGWESASGMGGRVYLRYQTGYNVMKTLVVYEDGSGCYYADDFTAMSGKLDGRITFVDRNGVVSYLNDLGKEGLDGTFVGAETDFGFAGRKTLSKLFFTGRGSFSFTVKNGGRSFSRAVTFENGVAEVPISERGSSFVFDFSLRKGAKIDKMTAEIRRFG